MTADKGPGDAEQPKPETDEAAEAATEAGSGSTGSDGDGDSSTTLAERTADLQRVTAEYHNYRKRVERDKAASADQATAAVVAGLLPVLDDIDRAREHGDLVGPFATVAESLQNALTKLGLEMFGEKGDPFDPVVHEAVAHMHSPEVTQTSCIDVMRRGYRLGDRLLRPAMVAVAEPAEENAPAEEVDDLDELGFETDAADTTEPTEPVDDVPDTDAETETDAAAAETEAVGDIDTAISEEAAPDLAADVPDDEEALKGEIVADAVEAASETDAGADTPTEKRTSSESEESSQDPKPDNTTKSADE